MAGVFRSLRIFKPKKRSFFASLRSSFLTGVLVLTPLVAVVSIVIWIGILLMKARNLVPNALSPKALFSIEDPLLSKILEFFQISLIWIFVFFLVCAVGLVSRHYLGHKLLEIIGRILIRVPVLRTVYTTLDQLLKTFAADRSKNFRKVVEIEYPRKGITTLALVTGERANTKQVTVFVPTTPNPTSGFYLKLSSDEVKDVNMTVEDALKEILSMGLVHRD